MQDYNIEWAAALSPVLKAKKKAKEMLDHTCSLNARLHALNLPTLDLKPIRNTISNLSVEEKRIHFKREAASGK